MLDSLDETEIVSRFRHIIGDNAARHIAPLAARGHRRVTLWVFEANSRARRLYERMGFEADGSRRVEDAYGAQEVRLSRELGS
jgi:hypothetical protein